jgi:hypothetical protein
VLVRPMIDGWEIPRIARIASGEARRISFLPVPGLIGDLSQDLGRGALVVEISGSLYGNEARDMFLKQVREAFLAGEPVDFIADIVNESELEQVLIESLDLEENGGNPDECFYRIRLCEYTEPPEPPGLAPDFGAELDPDLDLEADLGLDLLDLPSLPDLPGLPITLPKLGDALAPLKPAAESLRSAVAGAATLLDPLDDLLG